MDLIATEAHVSKRTLYVRYPGKADLFADVISAFHSSRLDELKGIVIVEGSMAAQLRDLSERMLAIMIQPDVIAMERVIAGEAHRFPQLAARMYREVGLGVLAVVTAVLGGFQCYRHLSAEELELDAQIFLALVLLPPLRRAMLDTDLGGAVDERLLQRSIEIFVAGTGRA